MTETKRKNWRTIWDRNTYYKLWLEYLITIDWFQSPEWLSRVYEDWNLDGIKYEENDTGTGTISDKDFDVWWKENWVELFGEDEYTGDVQKVSKDDDFTDVDYVYVKIEIPPKRIETKKDVPYQQTLTPRLNEMMVDNLKFILGNETRKRPRFPVSSHQGGLEPLKRRLEFYIWKQRVPPFTSTEPRTPRELRNQELREKVEFLSTNVPHLKEDEKFQSRPYPTKLKRIKREDGDLDKTIENLKDGTFP